MSIQQLVNLVKNEKSFSLAQVKALPITEEKLLKQSLVNEVEDYLARGPVSIESEKLIEILIRYYDSLLCMEGLELTDKGDYREQITLLKDGKPKKYIIRYGDSLYSRMQAIKRKVDHQDRRSDTDVVYKLIDVDLEEKVEVEEEVVAPSVDIYSTEEIESFLYSRNNWSKTTLRPNLIPMYRAKPSPELGLLFKNLLECFDNTLKARGRTYASSQDVVAMLRSI